MKLSNIFRAPSPDWVRIYSDNGRLIGYILKKNHMTGKIDIIGPTLTHKIFLKGLIGAKALFVNELTHGDNHERIARLISKMMLTIEDQMTPYEQPRRSHAV